MKLEINLNGEIEVIDLTALAAQNSNRVTVGRKCKHVWNTIPLDDESVDVFQCRLVGLGETFKIIDGQERTECPKGLLSSKLIPCNGCTGRCVNIHPGRPKYVKHKPESHSLLNGKEISIYGDDINIGDVISFGNVMMTVVD